MLTFVDSWSGRLILTVDCTKGELSRAFRNRGIEIYMLGEVSLQSLRCVPDVSVM